MKNFLLIFLFFSSTLFSQNYFQFTEKVEKEKFKTELTGLIYKTIANNPDKNNKADWEKALWGIELLQLKNDTIFNALKNCLNSMQKMPDDFKRSAMETVYGLYPKEFRTEFEKYIDGFNPKIFAIIANYFIQSCADKSIEKSNLFSYMEEAFRYYWTNPILFSLSKEFENKEYPLPSLKDLLTHSFGNKPVIFVFQRKNRNYPGITILRNPDGSFEKEKDGTLFYVNQLARSMSGMPSYITNGNTPEGVFSIQEVSNSTNTFIGPSPTIVTALPFEVPTGSFFHNSDTASWKLETYRDFLPVSWQKYYPIFKAFYSGQAGRNEIIVHGSTTDPEYYKEKSYYPFTPSMGCIISKEIWDDSGSLVESHQQKLVEKLKTFSDYKGYLIVLDLDDKQSPVTIEEITGIINSIKK